MLVRYYDPRQNDFLAGDLIKAPDGWRVESSVEGPDPDVYLSPGWIDIHTHIYDGVGVFGISADDIGWRHGVCLTVDAGTVGDLTLTGFRKYIEPSTRTKVKIFLNISPIGTICHGEYSIPNSMDPVRTAETAERNRDLVRGIKVRMSREVLTEDGLDPLINARRAADMAGLPLMVHIGGTPPSLRDMEPYFNRGDIITHAFNSRGGDDVWDAEGLPQAHTARLLDKGVLLDVGHGNSSFSFSTFERAAISRQLPFLVGTDLHRVSVKRRAICMPSVLSKLYGCGASLRQLIWAVTAGASDVLGLEGWCELRSMQNATLFRVCRRRESYLDSDDQIRTFDRAIEPLAVLLDGEWLAIDGDALGKYGSSFD